MLKASVVTKRLLPVHPAFTWFRVLGLGPTRHPELLRFLQCTAESAWQPYPDPREDLESRSPNLGPYTAKGTL